MKRIDSDKILSLEEVRRPNTPYVFTDNWGNDVVVREMIPNEHTAHDFNIMNDPLVYNNLGYAVKTANQTRLGRSDGAGAVKIFKKDGFFGEINHPGKEHLQNTAVVIAVKYGTNGKNKVVTYYDKPKGAVW